MSTECKIAIICITAGGKSLGCKIRNSLNTGTVFFVNSKNDENIIEDNVVKINKKLKVFVSEIFDKYDTLVFIMATGIVVRTIAPLIESKFADPAILVTDEKGTNMISLLSGHMGGANEMTLHISSLIGANPVITTATDVNKKSSLDMIAKKLDGHIDDFRDNVLKVNSMLVNNKPVGIYIDGEYNVDTRGFVVCDKLNMKNMETVVVVSNKENLSNNENTIHLVPKDIVVGIGCRRNTDTNLMINSLKDFLHKENININSIQKIGSIDIKKDEKALIELGEYLNVPFKTFTVEEISTVDHLYDKSEWVKKNVGVYSVAEPVTHLMSEGNLIVNKHKYEGITFSIGRVNI